MYMPNFLLLPCLSITKEDKNDRFCHRPLPNLYIKSPPSATFSFDFPKEYIRKTKKQDKIKDPYLQSFHQAFLACPQDHLLSLLIQDFFRRFGLSSLLLQ